jgi:hypothetical protein
MAGMTGVAWGIRNAAMARRKLEEQAEVLLTHLGVEIAAARRLAQLDE